MKRCFMIGGMPDQQKKFLDKVNAIGYPLEYIGGYDSDVNPSNMRIPSDCVCMILKDKISHKQRDLAKSMCASREDVIFIETASKISKAVDTLAVVLGHNEIYQSYAHVEHDRPLSEEEQGEDPSFLNAVLNVPWAMFPYDPRHSGSRKNLSNYWLNTYRKNDTAQSAFLPSMSEVKKGLKIHPMLHASDLLRQHDKPGRKETAILSAKAWLLGAEESGYTFLSKHALNRALSMTFGLTPEDLPEALWCELLKKPEKKSKTKTTKPTENPITENPITEETENVTDTNQEVRDEVLIHAEQDEGVYICGALLQITGDLSVKAISVDDLLVCGPYNVSIGKVEDGILHDVLVSLVKG